MKKIYNIINSEGFRYIIVGGLTTLVNLIVYQLLYDFFGVDVTISNIISVSVSILFAYIANKIVVFKSKTNSILELLQEMIKFCGARVSTMIIEVGGVYLMYNILNIHPMIAKVVTQFIVITGNYFISKLFVFKNREK